MKRLLTTASLLVAMVVPAYAEGTKIGVITTLSGPAGYLGEQIRDGLTLGLDASGAAYELVVEDDGREAMAGGESWSDATHKFAMAREGWPGWRCLTGL